MNSKNKIIEIFEELYLLHITLENIYEARSYKKIVDILKKYPYEIKSEKDLEGIPNIGKRTLIKVGEILRTGKLKLLEDMKNNKKINLTHMQIIGLKYFDELNSKISRSEITKFVSRLKKIINKKFSDIEI